MEIAVSVQPIGTTRSTRALSEITLSKCEIGLILGVSEHTADKFIRSARLKLHAGNRTHAVAQAMRLGLIV
jgi:DNA-binding CsgD family transcriptional regulator